MLVPDFLTCLLFSIYLFAKLFDCPICCKNRLTPCKKRKKIGILNISIKQSWVELLIWTLWPPVGPHVSGFLANSSGALYLQTAANVQQYKWRYWQLTWSGENQQLGPRIVSGVFCKRWRRWLLNCFIEVPVLVKKLSKCKINELRSPSHSLTAFCCLVWGWNLVAFQML